MVERTDDDDDDVDDDDDGAEIIPDFDRLPTARGAIWISSTQSWQAT
jgi:hypothetical protein